MPIRIARSIDNPFWVSPSRELAHIAILWKISIIKCRCHPSNTLFWWRERSCVTTISISYISDIIWCFEIIPECCFCKSDTHDKTWIYPCIECCISPYIPVLEITSCIRTQKIFLTSFFCLSFYDKSSIILWDIDTWSDTFDDISDKFILVSWRKIRIIKNRSIEYSQWIDTFSIFPYFKMQMCSCCHRTSS